MQTVKIKTTSVKTVRKLSKIKDCPYCKSELTETERDFFPCSCTFQACVDCYKDIMKNKGVCPTCHTHLKFELGSLHASKREELSKTEMDKAPKKSEKKSTVTTTVVTTVSIKGSTRTEQTTSSVHHNHEEATKAALSKMSFTELSRLRVIQKNMVYVIGLSPQVAKSDILEKFEYFGQYGKVTKVIVNKSNVYNAHGPGGPSYSAYISFSNDIEASIAILAVDEFVSNDRIIRASYGTTKYCTFFLRDKQCPNPTCLYLHSIGKERDSFLKDENVSNKDIFNDQQKLALEHIHKHYQDILKKINLNTKSKSIFPSVKTIQEKLKNFIEENEKQKAIIKNKEIVEITPEKSNETVAKKVEDTKTEINIDEYPNLGSEKTTEETKQVDETPKKNIKDTEKDASNKEQSSNEDQYESNQTSSSNKTGNIEKKEDVEEKATTGVEENIEEIKENKESEIISQNFQDPFSGNVNLVCLLGKIDFKDQLKEKHNTFDTKILEHLISNINTQSASRFNIVRHDGRDEYEENGQEDNNDDKNEEFSIISKSIQEFIFSVAPQTGPNVQTEGSGNNQTTDEGNLYGSPSYSVENYPNFSTPTKKRTSNVNSNSKTEGNNSNDLSGVTNKEELDRSKQSDKDISSKNKINFNEDTQKDSGSKGNVKGKVNKKSSDKTNNKPLNSTNNGDKNGVLRGVPNINRDTSMKSSSDKSGMSYTKNINNAEGGFNISNNSNSYNLIQTTL